MGGEPHMAARKTWAEFARSPGSSFFMNFDWIRIGIPFYYLLATDKIEWSDSTHGIKVWIEK